MTDRRVLVADDDDVIQFALKEFLASRGYETTSAVNCQEALAAIESQRFDASILDYRLPDGDALELMTSIRDRDADLPVIVLTGHGSIDLAVRSIQLGADHFLTKPIELPSLVLILERLTEGRRNQRKNLVETTRRSHRSVDPFAGSSRAIHALRDAARRLLNTQRPVLIEGETGTGKGLLAHWLYEHGQRPHEAFVDLNCAGLDKELLESELFGHGKGAFTGADNVKQGLLEVAHKGTAFLDEIGDIDLAVQPKLLKVIEDMRFRRLGETRDRIVDVRLIAATHQDLAVAVDEGRFRADLFYRICALPIRVPALRERTEDIPVLASLLLRGFCTELGKHEVRLLPGAIERLQEHDWPGNIRELRNVIERAVLLIEGEDIRAEDLSFDRRVRPPAARIGGDLTLGELERLYIERVLREENGRVATAAERLGMPKSTLYQKIKSLGIQISRL